MRIRGCATSKKYFIVQFEDSLFSDDFGKVEAHICEKHEKDRVPCFKKMYLIYTPDSVIKGYLIAVADGKTKESVDNIE